MSLTLERLRETYRYEDGELWHIRLNRRVGTVNDKCRGKKYLVCNVKGKNYLVHRLIFWLVHGYLPEIIDHIDRNSLNNKIENLRESTHSQNLHNTKIYTTNISGYKGVTWRKKVGKWIVQIGFQRKTIYLGLYSKLEDAVAARLDAEEKVKLGWYNENFKRNL